MKADEPLAYCNGTWLGITAAGLPMHDAGLVYGATVTDMVRTFRHQLFRLDDHVRRFRRSCELCHVPLQRTDTELAAIATELTACNARSLPPDSDLAVVLLATPGPLGMYIGEVADGPPSLWMHTFPLPFDRHRSLFQVGARLVIPPIHGSATVDPRAKQRSRMQWWIARRQARAVDPQADALWLDADGFVTETASANVIAVFGNDLVTPPAGTVLPGVSLAFIRGLAEKLGFRFREARMRPEECIAADELLLTCTTWCLAGVSCFDGHAVQWPGPVYRTLLAKWSVEVGIAIERQWLTSSSCL